MTTEPVIYVVDDNALLRESIRTLLECAGYIVRDYSSAKLFLADRVYHRGCVIVDICMPEMNGLEMQEEMVKHGIDLPVIVITGHGDVALAVRAMKAGAVEFLEKVFDCERLLASVRQALVTGEKVRAGSVEAATAKHLLALLTPREHCVLEQLVAGHSNKVAAYELGISPRTIEIHRAHIMDKLNAHNLSDVVRIALTASWTKTDDAYVDLPMREGLDRDRMLRTG